MCETHREYELVKRKEYQAQLKIEVFQAYGGCFCVCCGCDLISALSIDHTNNDGATHRKEIGGRNTGNKFYRWLRQHNYPPGFQVMCMTCNFSKKNNGGVCEHQTRLRTTINLLAS